MNHKRTPLSKCRTKRVSSTRKKLIKGDFKFAMTIEDVGDDTTMESDGSDIIESTESGATEGSEIIESAESGETFDDVFIISSSTCSGESEEKHLSSEKSGCAGENEEKHSSPEKFRCAEMKHDEWSLKNLFEDTDGSTTKGEMNDILESPRRRSLPGSKSPKRNILCSTMIESPKMPFSQFFEESGIPSSISVEGKIAGIQHQRVSNQKTKLPQTGRKVKSFPMEILEQNLQKKNLNKVPLGIKRNLLSVKKSHLNNCKEVLSKRTHKKDFYEALRDQLVERSSFEEVIHKSRKAKSFPVKTAEQNLQKNNTNKVPSEIETNLPSVNRTPPNLCTDVLSKTTNEEDFDETLCANTLSEMSSEEKAIHEMRKRKPPQVEKNKGLREKIPMKKVPLKTKRKLPHLNIFSKCKKSLPKSSSARDLCETPRVLQRAEKYPARKNLLYETFKPNSEMDKSTKETKQDMQERSSSNSLSSTKPYDHLVDLTYNIKSGNKDRGITSQSAERSDEDPLAAERSDEDPLAILDKAEKHPSRFHETSKPNSETDKSTEKINENVLERRPSNRVSTSELLDNFICQSEPADILRTPLQVTGKNSESETVKKYTGLKILKDGNTKIRSKKNVTNLESALPREKRKTTQEITTPKLKKKYITTLRTNKEAMIERQSYNASPSSSSVCEHSSENVATLESDEHVEQSSLRSTEKEEEFQEKSKTVKKHAGLQTLQDRNAKKNSKKKVTNQKSLLPKKEKGITQKITPLKKKRKKITMLRTSNQATLEKKSHNRLSTISEHSTEYIAVPESEENVKQLSSLRHTDTEEEMEDMLEGDFGDKTKTSKSKEKKEKYKKNKSKAGSSRAKTVSVEEEIRAYKEFLKTVDYDDLSLRKWFV